MYRFIIAAVISLCFATAGAEEPAAVQPTLSGNAGIHDPSVIETEDGWVAFHTGQEGGVGGGAVQIKTSSDGLAWANAGTLTEAIPEWIHAELGFQPRNLWAPSVSRRGDTYYLYYSASSFGVNTSAIGLTINRAFDPKSPAEGWEDQGMVLRSKRSDRWNAIDPWRINTSSGEAWLAFGSFWDGIKMRQLDPENGLLLAGNDTLYDLASRGGGAIEAASIIEHDGKFYLFVSFDQCCKGNASTYRIMVGRADAVTGPYVDAEGKPMMQGGGTELQAKQGRFIGPGGQEAIHGSTGDLLVYHFYDRNNGGVPKMQISPIIWRDDGWPKLGPLPQ